ncbi:MAG: hypothetical protein ACOYO9_11145 [Candidatus Nanopelagicales bacterium]
MSEKETDLETLPEADLVFALQRLSASRELRRTSMRELRDSDLPRFMGLAWIELIEPAALEQARRWTAFRAALQAELAWFLASCDEMSFGEVCKSSAGSGGPDSGAGMASQ